MMTIWSKRGVAVLGACGALAFSGLASANTITLTGYNGTPNTLTCNGANLGACMGFTGNPPGGPATGLSDSVADNYSKNGASNAANELVQLNSRLVELGRVPVTTVMKTDVAGDGFVVDTQYFSIKKQNFLWFFENTSMSSLTVAMDGEDYSHWTKYGDTVSEVPLPAAAWLFGSGLIALASLKRRK